MKKLEGYAIIFMFLFALTLSCTQRKHEVNQVLKEKDTSSFTNRSFNESLDFYIKYLSDKKYDDKREYIYIKADTSKNKTKFIVCLVGGSYDFFHDSTKIVDFIDYKKYHLLLVGDFPNIVVNIKKNAERNISKEILLKYFKEDYEKFKKDGLEPTPEIYDYMNMNLEFNGKGHIILMKCEYY